MRFVSHHCDFCSETFVSPPRASRLWRGLWGERLDPMGSSAMNPEVQLQHVFPWEKWTTKRTCWTYSLWVFRNEHNEVYWCFVLFWCFFCGSLVSVEHRKNMFCFLRHPLDQELFVVDMMWTNKYHKQWHKCRTGSGRCHVCLHGKACSSASFVAGCGVVYPRLVPPSLGIYPWVLHIVIGCSSLWKRSNLVKTNSGWNRQLMPTRNNRRPEKGYRWILEGSTLQNQWLMRIVTLGFSPNTIVDICCSKIYSFRICLLGHQHSHTRSESVKYVSQHLNPYCNGRLFCWWLHSFATFSRRRH